MFVIPADPGSGPGQAQESWVLMKIGIQCRDDVWVPVFTGMTILVPCCSHAHGRLRSTSKEKTRRFKNSPLWINNFSAHRREKLGVGKTDNEMFKQSQNVPLIAT